MSVSMATRLLKQCNIRDGMKVPPCIKKKSLIHIWHCLVLLLPKLLAIISVKEAKCIIQFHQFLLMI